MSCIRLLLFCLLFVVTLCSCARQREGRANLDKLPELKPFLDVCGRYLGESGADLNLVEFEFKPKLNKEELLLSIDRIAQKEGWLRSEQSEGQQLLRIYSKTNTIIQQLISMTVYYERDTMRLCLQNEEQRVEQKDEAQRKPYLKSNSHEKRRLIK